MGTFQDRLKELRKEKDITIEQLASDLGSAKSTISRYENGLREPKKDFLEMLSSYFDVSIDYLLGKTNTKKQLNNSYKEKDIEKAIDELMEQQGLMLSGEPLNEEDLFLLRNSIRNTLEFAKSLKKKK